MGEGVMNKESLVSSLVKNIAWAAPVTVVFAIVGYWVAFLLLLGAGNSYAEVTLHGGGFSGLDMDEFTRFVNTARLLGGIFGLVTAEVTWVLRHRNTEKTGAQPPPQDSARIRLERREDE
jgi:ammonia channel protein AmtB